MGKIISFRLNFNKFEHTQIHQHDSSWYKSNINIMITLLASIAGFISSLIPEILKFIKDKNDKNHEVCIFDRQIEYSKHNNINYTTEKAIPTNVVERSFSVDITKPTACWVDALNGTVRPMLAYCFFIMYSTVKFIQYKALSVSIATLVQYLDIIWNLEDQAIFAGIISFYFGQRTFSKSTRNK